MHRTPTRHGRAQTAALTVIAAAAIVPITDAASSRVVGAAIAPAVDNVVVIITDDMTYADYAYMPKTQRLLGLSGVTFDNAHQNTPLCCPARATLLTGQRSANHGVTTNKPEQGQGYVALDHSNTIATWFEAAGHDAIFVGKFLNGYGQSSVVPDVPNDREVPPGWTDFQALVGHLNYYNFTLNDDGEHVRFPTAPGNYQTDVLATRATDSIKRSLAAGQRFFMMLAPQAPHTYGANPPLAAPRHEGMFASLPVTRPPSFNEADVSDKPGYVRSSRPISRSATAKLDRQWRDRLEALQSVDDMVESVVTTLRAARALDRTLIVFMSDNGYLFGEHRLTGKVRPYEESTHVPLVMRGGPFRGGAVVDHVVSSTDILPTIVAQTGIAPGRIMDGLDLSSVLTDPARYDNRAIIIESVEGPGYEAVRTERWMWIDYSGSGDELYDMVNDPYQLTSLGSTAGPPAAVRTELDALLDDLRTCTGTACIAFSDA